MEITFYKIEEHYHELQMQNLQVRSIIIYSKVKKEKKKSKAQIMPFQVSEENIDHFYRLKESWLQTYDLGLRRKVSLNSARIAATATIQNLIDRFDRDFQELSEKYRAATTNLDNLNFDSRNELITASF